MTTQTHIFDPSTERPLAAVYIVIRSSSKNGTSLPTQTVILVEYLYIIVQMDNFLDRFARMAYPRF